jgi:predicted nucleic acid-binding protein
MHVVSDADVLIHLSKLEKLHLLQSLYKEVAIPNYVISEILIKEDTELQKALNSFLKVFTISKDKPQDIAKRHNIHSYYL